MGNDGGSIPKRRELVKDAARAPTLSELKATALESLAHSWSHCALGGGPIDLDSVVSDWRGRLYSYESVLKGLMPADVTDDEDDDAANPTKTLASMGVKSLRDVSKLKFAKNGDKWICPISMKEMGPATKAVYIVPCGHVFADLAMKEIQAKTCPECAGEFQQDNVIVLLPTTEKEVGRLEKRIEDLRATGLTHTLKKDKSEKKKKRKGDDENGDVPEERKKKKKQNGDSRIDGINNTLAASLTAKVLAEQDEVNKRRKLVAESMQGREGLAKG